MAATESSSSWSPQPKAQPPPPIAQAPKPARVMVMSVCPKGTLVSVSVMSPCSASQLHLSNSRLRLVQPPCPVPGRGYHSLSQADPAVVRRDPGMGQYPEAPGLQQVHHGPEQQQVLEHPAGQCHRVQPGPVPQQPAGLADHRGHTLVEPG